MPRLVVVVDELRTLVDEVPEFVSGLVRLAAQGRSLGMHLVLATQRPAGAITAEVQANVSLRIAFRVRDRADSVAVVEDGAAAELPATTPGQGGGEGGRRPAAHLPVGDPRAGGPQERARFLRWFVSGPHRFPPLAQRRSRRPPRPAAGWGARMGRVDRRPWAHRCYSG